MKDFNAQSYVTLYSYARVSCDNYDIVTGVAGTPELASEFAVGDMLKQVKKDKTSVDEIYLDGDCLDTMAGATRQYNKKLKSGTPAQSLSIVTTSGNHIETQFSKHAIVASAIRELLPPQIQVLGSQYTDKDKRIEAFKNARTSAMKIIDAYRPGSNNESIRNMTGEQIGNMSAARRYNSFEFKYAIVENLTDMLNGEDNPVMQKYLAIEQLDQLADNEVAKRVYWLQRSVGGITFTGINMEDQMVQLNLQIHDGQLSFQEYLAKIQAFKLKVSDTVGSFLLLSLQAAKLAAANGDLPEGVTIDSLGANMGGFSVGSKLSKEQSQWLKEKGQAYALENGIDPAQFSLTNGSKSKQKKDIDAVVSWYRKRMGLNFEDTNKGNGGNNGKTNSLTNNNGGNNRSTNPYQIDQSGYKNQYQRPTARPTQIVFNIENLCNFDKNEFLTADEKEVANQIMPRVIHAVTQAVATAQTQIGAMPDAGNGSQV